MAKKLSYIVPLFNSKDFIIRCLDSLVNQNLSRDEYEIIVINDGSTDGSLEIVREYARSFENIILIDQNNKGVAATRNVGLSLAEGKYIWQVDHDDWIVENCAKQLIQLCENDDLDMLEVAPSIAVTGNFSNDLITNPPGPVYSGKELLINSKAVIGIWSYIVSKDFLAKNHLSFNEAVINEDQEFTPRALYFAQRVRLLNFSVYNYFQQEGSIVHSFSEKRLYQFITISKSLKRFSREEVKENVIRDIFISMSNGSFLAAVSAMAKYRLDKNVLKKVVAQGRNENVYPLSLEFSSIPRFLIVLMVNFCPQTYLFLLRLIKRDG